MLAKQLNICSERKVIAYFQSKQWTTKETECFSLTIFGFTLFKLSFINTAFKQLGSNGDKTKSYICNNAPQ